jgi:mannan endo-1,4-beta-mannosidase
MVETNKLNNLIWVWNINTDPAFGYDYSALNAAWYPGDEYVDIVAVDIYDPLNDHNSAANYYNKIVSDVGTSKMIALSENGAIPDIDSIAEDKAYWSYWMTWSQTWSGNFLEKTPTDMWKRNLDDERIIALDNMPGWDKVTVDTSITPDAIEPKVAIVASKFDVNGNSILLTTAKAGNVSVDIFSMNGKRITTLYRGNIAAGNYSFSLENMPKGSYIVRVKGAGITATQPVLVR